MSTPGRPWPCGWDDPDADTVVSVIERLVAERGAPEHLRMDDGPEPSGPGAAGLGSLAGTTTTYIEPGSPWENPFIESFNGRVRDELLNTEEFASLLEAQVLAEAWRITLVPRRTQVGLLPRLVVAKTTPAEGRSPTSMLTLEEDGYGD